MLTREQRDKWAEELESGRWKQAYGMLRDRYTGYCCLGVLNFIVRVNPNVLKDKEYRRFCNLNDTDKLTFPKIAKHVRALPVSDE